MKDSKTFKTVLLKKGSQIRKQGQVLQKLAVKNKKKEKANDFDVDLANEDNCLADKKAKANQDELVDKEYKDKKK